jgi:hypothetical protein
LPKGADYSRVEPMLRATEELVNGRARRCTLVYGELNRFVELIASFENSGASFEVSIQFSVGPALPWIKDRLSHINDEGCETLFVVGQRMFCRCLARSVDVDARSHSEREFDKGFNRQSSGDPAREIRDSSAVHGVLDPVDGFRI